MDFDINKKMKEDEEALNSLEKRNIIYYEHLLPLKAKISQILLYDSEVATTLLQRYLKIEKNEDRAVKEIIADIADLQDDIQEYEDNRGKEKRFKEQSRVLSNQLEDLLVNSEEIDIEDFESTFLDIKELYDKNLEEYSYKDRSVIEEKISKVQAKLIIRRVRLGALDLHKEISKDDVMGLTMVINNIIFDLMENQNSDVQNIINEIKYKMIDRTDVVYDPEIWRLLDSAQTGKINVEPRIIEVETRKANTSNALVTIVPKKHKGFALPNLKEIFGRNVIKIGDQKMKVATTVQIGGKTIKVKDLGEIDLDWLALQVPQQMLIDMENEQLRKEGKINIEKKFMPLGQTLIYNEFDKIDKFNGKDECAFYNESGTKLYYRFKYDEIYLRKYLENENGDHIKAYYDRFQFIDNNTKIIKYAELIDKITGSNLKQQLLNELGVCIEKQILRNDMPKDMRMDLDEKQKIIHKLPILSNLSKSYQKVIQQIEETKLNVGGEVKSIRDNFYERIKVEKDNKNEKLIDESGKQIKKHSNERINPENGYGKE